MRWVEEEENRPGLRSEGVGGLVDDISFYVMQLDEPTVDGVFYPWLLLEPSTEYTHVKYLLSFISMKVMNLPSSHIF